MEKVHIAIVGSGIAGLTLALALFQNGVEVDLFERAAQLQEGGAGIQISPNAARFLHCLGLRKQLQEVAVQPAAVEMRRWDDNGLLVRYPLGEECERLFGAPYYTIHRADLQRLLKTAVPEQRLHLDHRCIEITPLSTGVQLRFANGSTVIADLVVGADGIHSVVRNALIADQPQFSGESVYRALVPAQHVPFLLAEPKVILWLGPQKHVACYPVARGTRISFSATVPADDWHIESWTAEGRVEDLVAAYTGWNEQLMQIIRSAESVQRWALYDRPSVSHWSHGSITLLGDAAHPMLPFLAQGANQAIEDAWVLARCLKHVQKATISKRLGDYERIRQPRTAEVQRVSRSNTELFHLPDGEQQHQRDTIMETFTLQSQAWLFGYDMFDILQQTMEEQKPF